MATTKQIISTNNAIAIGPVDYDSNCDSTISSITVDDNVNANGNDSENMSRLRREENLDEPRYHTIFRYKFTQEFMDELYQFSKVHQYDDRHGFKDAWLIWTAENEELINNEISRLSYLQYNGDILDKMFKSARYYFRKKSTIKPKPCERRDYVSVQRELLDAMDLHIETNMLKIGANYKPSDGFSDFCNTNIVALQTEMAHLVKHGMCDVNIIRDKIKKTYKNRYFMKIGTPHSTK